MNVVGIKAEKPFVRLGIVRIGIVRLVIGVVRIGIVRIRVLEMVKITLYLTYDNLCGNVVRIQVVRVYTF